VFGKNGLEFKPFGLISICIDLLPLSRAQDPHEDLDKFYVYILLYGGLRVKEEMKYRNISLFLLLLNYILPWPLKPDIQLPNLLIERRAMLQALDPALVFNGFPHFQAAVSG